DPEHRLFVRSRPADPPLSQPTRMHQTTVRNHTIRQCRLATPALEFLRDHVYHRELLRHPHLRAEPKITEANVSVMPMAPVKTITWTFNEKLSGDRLRRPAPGRPAPCSAPRHPSCCSSRSLSYRRCLGTSQCDRGVESRCRGPVQLIRVLPRPVRGR